MQLTKWVRRTMTVAAVSLTAVVAIAIPAYAGSGFESYENDGSGLGNNNCLYMAGTSVKVGNQGDFATCFGARSSENDFSWEWKSNSSGKYEFLSNQSTSGNHLTHCLDINSSDNAYGGSCSYSWTVRYLNGGTSTFNLIDTASGLCLGVGSSSLVVEARACSSSSYQIWKD